MDQKFLETYIDMLVGNMNRLQLENVQYQTQAKLHEQEINDASETIKKIMNSLSDMENKVTIYSKELQEELNKNNLLGHELDDLKRKYDETQQKLSHMNTFQNEIGRLNNTITNLNKEMDSKNKEIEELKNQKIETKSKRKQVKTDNKTE